MPTTENHPDSGPAPKLDKATFDPIGTYIPLKDTPNSANQKSGDPFGSGGK